MANFQIPAGAQSLKPVTQALFGTQPTQVTDVSPSFWFSPLQPVTPSAPAGTGVRQWGYQPGANLSWQPKTDESGYGYELLRALAENLDILRIVLEMKKDEICDVEYEVRLKRLDGEKQADYKNRAQKGAKDLQAVKHFWTKPDGQRRWRRWLRMLSEDLLVIDAMSVYLARDTRGRVASLMPVDGATWNRLLTDQGITPHDPDSAAFQQILYGFASVDVTINDIVYAMQNERTFRRYGYSRVERIFNTIALAMNRQNWVTSEYAVGNIPEAFLFMPSNIPPQRLKEFQDYLDAILSGNLANRRKLRIMPGFGDGGKPNYLATKEPLLKDELDIWLAQLCCACVGVSAQPFLKMMNRSSAEEANDAAREKMLKPDVDHICDFANDCMEKMGLDDYEMAAKAVRDTDPLKQAQADKMVWGIVYTANEIREQRGEDPIEGKNANRLGTISPQQGFIPLDPDDDDLALMQQMKAPPPGSGPNGTGTPKPKPGTAAQKALSAGALEKYKYGCVMVPIDPNSEAGKRMKAMRDGIDDAHLMAGNGDGKTREDEPHATIRYGIKGETEGLAEYLTQLKPFTLTFGRSFAFAPSPQSEGAAPLVVSIESPELHAINAELADQADFTDPTFDYSPHATLAYVAPEYADRYTDDDYLDGVEYPVRSIQYAMPDGETHEIMLTGGFGVPARAKVSKGWVTMDGAHVFIGAGGLIERGPAHLLGQKPHGKTTAATDQDRVERARKHQVLCKADTQRIADKSEAKLAKALGIPRTRDNSAFDLRNDDVGIEVKTFVTNTNDKLTMSKTALGRKLGEAHDDGLRTFTVVADVRGGGAATYYVSDRMGSLRLGSMQKVTLAELRTMVR